MTESSTSTPIRQKGRGAKTETTPAAAAPGPFWHAPTVQARISLSTLFSAMCNLDGEDADDSSDAIRLLHIAADVVDDRFWIDESLPARDRQIRIANRVFDVQALITGALNFPDQPLAFERRALLGHASAICNVLTEMHSSGTKGEALVPQLLEVAKLQPQPHLIPVANTATPRRVVHDALGGYTPEQARLVLETIAGRTRTMQQLLMMVQSADDSYQEAVCLDAAVIIATEVGSMADMAVGGAIIGDSAYWTFGPNFATAGKAVEA